MSIHPSWSAEELQLLKDSYPKLGRCNELQELFPTRSLNGIVLKANRIGLRVIDNIRIGRTNEEYLSLVENTNFIPLEEYAGSTTPILHLCGICDTEWKARPQHILKKGAKCPNCDLLSRKVSDAIVDSTLAKVNLVRHSEYLGSFFDLAVEHITCKHKFTTKYSYIQQGSGCPVCNTGWAYQGGVVPSKASLYLLEVTVGEDTFLKIGVTIQPIKRRINTLRSDINKPNTLISLIHMVEHSGETVLKLEHRILKDYSIDKYLSTFYFAGCTELLDVSNNIEYIKTIMDDNEII